MQFKQILALAGLAVSAQAAVTAQQMTSNIDAITELSSQTNTVAQSISITNFFSTAPQLINNFRQIIQIASDDVSAMNNKRRKRSTLIAAKRQECLNVEDVQKCIDDLEEIIEDPSEILGDKKKNKRFVGSPAARSTVEARQNPGYAEADQQAICNSFRGFVTVHQQLLATVIGKHGLLSLTPFTQPIGQVLRTLEGGVDTLAFGIIDSVPSCAQDATQNKDSLDMTLEQAVNEYSD